MRVVMPLREVSVIDFAKKDGFDYVTAVEGPYVR